MSTSPASVEQLETATTQHLEAEQVATLDDSLIEDVSIDGMCGVY
jgi:mycofactocin precursor